eukprot:g4689.t1
MMLRASHALRARALALRPAVGAHKSTLTVGDKDSRVDSALSRGDKVGVGKALSRTYTRRDYSAEKVSMIFDSLDTDGSGKITKEQFQDALAAWDENEFSKLKRSLSRNELSRSGSRSGEAMANIYDQASDTTTFVSEAAVEDSSQNELSDPAVTAEKQSIGSVLSSRIGVTAEVAISKIFMAGFGWQGFSVIAEDVLGYSADSLGFALVTGAGDFTGVCLGHTAWMLGKASLVDDSIDTTAEFHTGLLLGSAAFCSGTAWQPTVNLLHDTLGLGFTPSAALTMAACGTAFFGGLRLFRAVFSPVLYGVEESNYANLKADAALSVSVGAATGAFVGTDLSFGAGNWLAPVVGIPDSASTIAGMGLAGTSTALGFSVVQMAQNVSVKPGHNWVD